MIGANAWINLRTKFHATDEVDTHSHARISHQVSDRVSRGKYCQTYDRIRQSKNKAEGLPEISLNHIWTHSLNLPVGH